ncbi:MAG: relaxase/mobilization nuclease domain-containing protein [Bacteroidota bacterium]
MQYLAAHLVRTDDNEAVRIADVRDLSRRRKLGDMLHAMHRTVSLTRGQAGLIHFDLDPHANDTGKMTAEAWEHAVTTLEQEFNLTEQPRVVVEHVKDGRTHVHVVYQVADVERGRQVESFKFSKLRCIKVARQLEEDLDLERVPSERTGKTFDREEHQQAKREGYDLAERRALIREAWQEAERDGFSADAFRAALAREGITLARGDKAPYVVFSGDEQAVNLTRELRGLAKTKDIRARLAGLTQEVGTEAEERARLVAEPGPELQAPEAQVSEAEPQAAAVPEPPLERAPANDDRPAEARPEGKRPAKDPAALPDETRALAEGFAANRDEVLTSPPEARDASPPLDAGRTLDASQDAAQKLRDGARTRATLEAFAQSRRDVLRAPGASSEAHPAQEDTAQQQTREFDQTRQDALGSPPVRETPSGVPTPANDNEKALTEAQRRKEANRKRGQDLLDRFRQAANDNEIRPGRRRNDDLDLDP